MNLSVLTERKSVKLLTETVRQFVDDDCMRMAAALAYYTVFSIAPLLVIVIAVLGLVLDPAQVQQFLQQEMGSYLGPESATQIETMVNNASQIGSGNIFALLLGIAGLLFGATGALSQLQRALNTAWNVEQDPETGGILNVLFKRLLSLGMILGIAFLLLVSLVLSTILTTLGEEAVSLIGAGISSGALWIINLLTSLFVITLLFAAIYKILPDVRIAWKDVWRGAFLTAVLFEAGKFLISFYLSTSDPASAFGAAGALALLLVWVYYSSIIIFFGAEFTQAWAAFSGRHIEPDEGAVRVSGEGTVTPRADSKSE